MSLELWTPLSLLRYQLHLYVRIFVRWGSYFKNASLWTRPNFTVIHQKKKKKENLEGLSESKGEKWSAFAAQMDSQAKTGKVYLQPHKAGKVSTFELCCFLVAVII